MKDPALTKDALNRRILLKGFWPEVRMWRSTVIPDESEMRTSTVAFINQDSQRGTALKCTIRCRIESTIRRG